MLQICVEQAAFALAVASVDNPDLKLTAESMAGLIIVAFFDDEFCKSERGLRTALALVPLCEQFLTEPWSETN